MPTALAHIKIYGSVYTNLDTRLDWTREPKGLVREDHEANVAALDALPPCTPNDPLSDPLPEPECDLKDRLHILKFAFDLQVYSKLCEAVNEDKNGPLKQTVDGNGTFDKDGLITLS